MSVTTEFTAEQAAYAELWRDAFFASTHKSYTLEESVAYANGAVDAFINKLKDINND